MSAADANAEPAPGARPAGWWRRAWLAVGATAAVLAVIVAGALLLAQRHQIELEGPRLQAVADGRAALLAQWLRERQAEADIVATSSFFADLYLRWADANDGAARDRLLERLVDYRRANGYARVMVLDAQGGVVAQEAGGGMLLTPAVRQAAQRALASGRTERTDLYRREGGVLSSRIDFVAPLQRTGPKARGAVVLHVDADSYLAPLLRSWPVPSETAETVLWRADGDRVARVSDARGSAAADGTVAVPRAQSPALAAQYLRGELAAGAPAEGVDEAGARILGVVQPVAGTDWLLVARVQRSELWTRALREGMWSAAAMVLAALAALAALRWGRARQDLQAERARLGEQQQRMRGLALLDAVAEASPDLIFAKDRAGRYLLYNRAAVETYQGMRSNMIGEDASALFAPDVADRIRRTDAQVIEEERTITYEGDMITPRGPRTFLNIKGPLRDAQGQVIGLFGIARDITERKLAEQALRRSEQRLELALSAGELVAWDWDLANKRVHWGAGMAELLDLPQGEGDEAGVPLDAVVALVHPDDRERVNELLREAFRSGPRFEAEYRVRVRTAQWRWFHAAALIERDAGGRVLRLVGTVQDVTERRQLADELERHRSHLEELVAERTRAAERADAARRQTERLAETIADNLPGLVSYWDRDLRCRFANKAYLNWFGRTPADVLGAPILAVLGEERFTRNEPYIRAALRGESSVVERTVRNKDGDESHHWSYYVSDIQGGEVQGLFVLTSDVTRLKSAELRLTQLNAELTLARDRAEGANRAKSAFLANMSHEIRTPMNAVIGLTHLMQRDSTDALAQDRLAKVAAAAEHLMEIINDILDLSKIEAGQVQLERTDFSLAQLLARVGALIGDRARAKGLALQIDVAQLPDALHGDPTRLSQALLNLLSNAVKFTPDGSITLRGSVVERSAGEVLAKFEVIDTGIGIDADKTGALFDAFVQADSSTTRRYGGTGLGLAITRHLAELMGGTVGVQSTPGAGSTFWFTARLGVREAGVAARPGEPAPPTRAQTIAELEAQLRRQHGGARVLLAEDDPVSREVALALMRPAGLEVSLAENGAQALALARSGRPALILMDVQMPEMDGLAATRAIRALPEHERTPILALTANAFGEDRAACLAAGMNDHIAKPIDPLQMLRTLARWL